MRSPVRTLFIALAALLVVACTRPPDLRLQRQALLATDEEWSKSLGDLDKHMGYYAQDAVLHPQGKPPAEGVGEIRELLTQMFAAPGFALRWSANKAAVGTGGDLGYTSGTYEATLQGVTEQGKYVTVWRKQPDGRWKVVEDIFNSNGNAETAATARVLATPASIVWERAPGLPSGAKRALLVGDPAKPGPFVARMQFPAGIRLAPHWHTGPENVTVISGTISVGEGDTFDQAAMQDMTAGSYYHVPPNTHHYLMTKTAVTSQVHGIGPVDRVFVNPADDPRSKAK